MIAAWIFWIASFLVLYAYCGYPLWLWLGRRWCFQPVCKSEVTLSVSIVIAAHNEAAILPQKLDNLRQINYPQHLLEILVVSDGSTDATDQILNAAAAPCLRPLFLSRHCGKATALNCGIAAAKGDVVVFMDARQRIEPDAVGNLVRNFADPAVGCVSGQLMLKSDGAGQEGVGLYWRMEKTIRRLESETGSVVGATGALYAAQKNLLTEIPDGMLLDDVYLPLAVAARGKRIVFEPEARAWDEMPRDPRKEFRRKVRTLTGNYQLIIRAPWVLTRANPLRWRLVSHKLLRLNVPVLLILILLTSLMLRDSAAYSVLLITQIGFYLGALLGLKSTNRGIRKIAAPAAAFCLLNAAALVALWKLLFTRGSLGKLWVQPEL